ncbi:MAG TPA: hypothetical protein VKQ11_02660 [Candidatus Sulfotelmatobacter sp.]|nr:hypothetical protein [Candidatus Sulfotelmatobacter sp.]
MAIFRQLAACYACKLHEEEFMTSYRLTAAAVFLFLTVCASQAGDGFEAVVDLQLIHRILDSARVPGSLAYSSCGFRKRVPDDLPPMRVLHDYSGPPREVLQKVFAADPRMRVRTEKGGVIRMMETDVPTDLLNFKIRHLSFFPSGAAESDAVHGPQMAVFAIMENPEVKAFKKANNIGPFGDRFMLPGNCCGGGRVIHGELDDVTVSQALDYVLQTFPGFWVYENCVSKEGERFVYFNVH